MKTTNAPLLIIIYAFIMAGLAVFMFYDFGYPETDDRTFYTTASYAIQQEFRANALEIQLIQQRLDVLNARQEQLKVDLEVLNTRIKELNAIEGSQSKSEVPNEQVPNPSPVP